MIGFLVNPTNPAAQSVTNDVQAAARSLGRQIKVLTASTEREIDTTTNNNTNNQRLLIEHINNGDHLQYHR